MAKTKKKSAPVKSSSKKPAKSATKMASKAAASKKTAAKPAAKVAAAKHKKPTKPVAKAAKPAKVAKPVKAAKKPAVPVKDKKAVAKKAAPQKPEKKAVEKEPAKKTTVVAEVSVAPKAPLKKESKAALKKGKIVKKEEAAEEDDFVAEDDFGPNEISEYEDELKAVEELDEEVSEEDTWSTEIKDKGDEEIILTDAEGRRYCRSRDCDQVGIVDGYCRYHYLLYWKKIQVRKKILIDGKLEKYVEDLTARYPDKFLEMLRRDLRTEKDFLGAIQELEIDEGAGENEFEEENTAFVEEIRGIGEGAGSGVEEEEF